MKKYLFSSAFLAVAILFTGCSADDPAITTGGEGVTFKVKLPGNLSRAYGDAPSGIGAPNANHLVVSIFDTDNNYVTNQDIPDAFDGSLEQEVSLKLVKNVKYNIVFWAYNDNAKNTPYTYTASTGELEMNYSGVIANDESYDAFYSLESEILSDGSTRDVILKRPFAQINIGSNDLEDPTVQYIYSSIYSKLTITDGLYNSVNLLTSQLGDKLTTPQVFEVKPIPAPLTEGTMFPVEGYQNIQMNYLLVGDPDYKTAQKSLIEATLDLGYIVNDVDNPINTLNLSSTPVRTNYRTNIYGALLTTVNNFKVVIEPSFMSPDYVLDYTNSANSIDDLNDQLAKGGNGGFIVTGPVEGSDNVINIPSSNSQQIAIRFEQVADDAFVTVNNASRQPVILTTPLSSSADFEVNSPQGAVTLAGSYGNVTSNSSKLTVDVSSSVDEVTVGGGSVVVRGEVGSVTRSDDNTMETKTPVIVYEGGKLTTTPGASERIHVVEYPLFSGGAGTETSPYQLSTAKDFQDMLYLYVASEIDDIYRVPMELTQDIDMSSEPMRNLGISSAMINGNGHTLTVNFTSNSTEGAGTTVGLFAAFNGAGNDYIYEASESEKNSPCAYTNPYNGKTYIITGGCIRDLVIDGEIYSSNNNAVSPLGCSQNTGYILNVTNKAKITAAGEAYFVGGIISGTRGTGLVIGCTNYGDIDASQATGGVVGGITAQLYGGSSCNGTYPDIMAPYSASVYDCKNYGNITSGGKDVGGIVGQTHGYGNLRCILECTNTGNITGTTYVGGILGRHPSSGGTLYFNNNTNTGTVTATAADGVSGNYIGSVGGAMAEGSVY